MSLSLSKEGSAQGVLRVIGCMDCIIRYNAWTGDYLWISMFVPADTAKLHLGDETVGLISATSHRRCCLNLQRGREEGQVGQAVSTAGSHPWVSLHIDALILIR